MTPHGWPNEMFTTIAANERLRGLADPLLGCSRAALDVLDVAPHLAPDMNAICELIQEAVEHVLAAQTVLQERLAALREHV